MIKATNPPDDRYRKAGFWTDDTLSSVFWDSVERLGSRLAVVEGDSRLSYDALGRRVEELVSVFGRMGVQAGDVVAMQLPNWWECAAAFHATQAHGAVANPLIPIYREAELSFIVRQAQPKVMLIPHYFRGVDYAEMLQRVLTITERELTPIVVRARGDLPDGFFSFERLISETEGEKRDVPGARDVAVLMYTSGTTADPKGVLHSHETLVYECRSLFDWFGLQQDDILFMPSPLTHIAGLLYGIVAPVLLETHAVLLEKWDPTVGMALVEGEGCTFTLGATPFLQGLTEEYERAGSPSSLRVFACGGAAVPATLVRRSTRQLDACVVRIYGSTEFPTFSSGHCDDSLDLLSETEGRPIEPAEGRLIDMRDGVGELIVRGPDLFLGYLDEALNASVFTEEGFFRTGDLASFDRGYVTIQGRSKDIVIRGGENISAKEVEEHVYEHEAVREVAIVAIPDPDMGEKACAFVVLSPGHDTLRLEDLTEFLSTRGIAKQKHPERLVVVHELPKTPSGKVQKYVLREQAAKPVGDVGGQVRGHRGVPR